MVSWEGFWAEGVGVYKCQDEGLDRSALLVERSLLEPCPLNAEPGGGAWDTLEGLGRVDRG